MKQHEFCVTIQGVTLRILTNSINYVKYLEKYFEFIEKDVAFETDIEVFFDLEEAVGTVSGSRPFEQSAGLKRVGRRILANNNEVVCDGIGQLGNLKLRCVYTEKTKIYGRFSLIKSSYFIKRFYQQVLRKKKFDCYKFDVYAALTYYLIYFPVLYQLEKKNIFVLHASSVVSGGRGILMPGLPGVGKSTLCLAFLAGKDSKFLSDNIVLYDSQNVYSFFEPVKFDKYGMGLVNFNKDILVKMGNDPYYDRQSFRVREEYVIESARPQILLIPVRFSKTALIPISAQQAAQISLDINNIAGEVNSYLSYASIQNLCHKNDQFARNRIESLRKLCNSMKCYELSIRSGQKLDEVIKVIESSL